MRFTVIIPTYNDIFTMGYCRFREKKSIKMIS